MKTILTNIFLLVAVFILIIPNIIAYIFKKET